MKTCITNRFLLSALTAFLGSIMAGRVTAQTFTTLHSFTALSSAAPHGNSDGAAPLSGLVLSGNTWYGTAEYGGSSGNGTVFAMNTDGTGFTNLHSFAAGSGYSFTITNRDGAYPDRLVLSGNKLYGATISGGSSGNGTVFAVNSDGSGFTTLHTFTATSGTGAGYTNRDGACPGSLILSSNTLYGTASVGGSSGSGTVFTLNMDGSGFTTLYNFTSPYGKITYGNSDGAYPDGLVLSGKTLYGATGNGGNSAMENDGSPGSGTVFALNTDGTSFTTLYKFSASATNSSSDHTNIDGASPMAGLILSGNTLYGTASLGGRSGVGTVFAVNTNGSGFTTLHTFTNGTDGAFPYAELILSGNTLYGTAGLGGTSVNGTVFALNTDGSGFTTLYNFPASATNSSGFYTNSDGGHPSTGLLLTNNTLYGTAGQGGGYGNGTVFSLSLGTSNHPQLALIPTGRNLILTWPANAAGFVLQSTTNLAPPVVWSTNSRLPVVINGQNTVTNPISGAQQFFRLNQ